MCGIVGMAGNLLALKESTAFKKLLWMDTTRGEHSTGVVSVPVSQTSNMVWEKSVGLPYNLWDDGSSDIFNKTGQLKACPKMLLGHNRFATVGKINSDNAHPFEYGDIVGVHNGSLRDYKNIMGDHKCEVDSEYLVRHIAEKGIEETWSNFVGAATVVWWDSTDDSINFARNSERPLFLAHYRNNTALAWASERWMLEVAIGDSIDTVTVDGKKQRKCYQLKTNTHFKVKIKSNNFEIMEGVPLTPMPEKKIHPFDIPRKQAGGTIGYRLPTVYKGPKSKGANKAIMLNTDWAKGTKKVDSSFRDSPLVASICNKMLLGPSVINRQAYALKAKLKTPLVLEDGDCYDHVLIYPMDTKEKEFLYDLPLFTELEIAGRPRLAIDGYLKVIASGVKVVKNNELIYPTPYGGNKVNKQEMQHLLDNSAYPGCCAFCETTIEEEDMLDVEWFDKTSPVHAGCMRILEDMPDENISPDDRDYAVEFERTLEDKPNPVIH